MEHGPAVSEPPKPPARAFALVLRVLPLGQAHWDQKQGEDQMAGLLPTIQVCINGAGGSLVWEHSQEASNSLGSEGGRDKGKRAGLTAVGSDGPRRGLDRLSKLKAYPCPSPCLANGARRAREKGRGRQ